MRYSEGICGDGAAILEDGVMIPVEEIVKRLNHYDELKALLLWALYHHQGGNSTIGQPIRKVLGIGPHEILTREQIAEAQRAGGILLDSDLEELKKSQWQLFEGR
jgi:hypothetical protein